MRFHLNQAGEKSGLACQDFQKPLPLLGINVFLQKGLAPLFRLWFKGNIFILWFGQLFPKVIVLSVIRKRDRRSMAVCVDRLSDFLWGRSVNAILLFAMDLSPQWRTRGGKFSCSIAAVQMMYRR